MDLLNISIEEKHDYYEIYIPGTNQFADLFISAQCWCKDGFHAGVVKAVEKELLHVVNSISHSKRIIIIGHSLGAASAQYLGILLHHLNYEVWVHADGSYPIACKSSTVNIEGIATVYGNDPVPALFPWFKNVVHTRYKGPPRVWYKVIFLLKLKDHLEY